MWLILILVTNKIEKKQHTSHHNVILTHNKCLFLVDSFKATFYFS